MQDCPASDWKVLARRGDPATHGGRPPTGGGGRRTDRLGGGGQHSD